MADTAAPVVCFRVVAVLDLPEAASTVPPILCESGEAVTPSTYEYSVRVVDVVDASALDMTGEDPLVVAVAGTVRPTVADRGDAELSWTTSTVIADAIESFLVSVEDAVVVSALPSFVEGLAVPVIGVADTVDEDTSPVA